MTFRFKILSILAGSFDADRFWRIRRKLTFHTKSITRYYYHVIYQRQLNKFNAFIPLTAVFDSPPVLPHGISGIHISGNAHIGQNCVIFHQVTIGSTKNGAPRIGDDCFIGCGATIIGNVKIGNNVRIGANCTVVTDIPDDSTVVMNTARIITHNNKHSNIDMSNQ